MLRIGVIIDGICAQFLFCCCKKGNLKIFLHGMPAFDISCRKKWLAKIMHRYAYPNTLRKVPATDSGVPLAASKAMQIASTWLTINWYDVG